MLHHERKRRRELGEAEAWGESFWTDRFDANVRQKIAYALGDAAASHAGYVKGRAQEKLVKSLGVSNLSPRFRGSAIDDLDFFLLGDATDQRCSAFRACWRPSSGATPG